MRCMVCSAHGVLSAAESCPALFAASPPAISQNWPRVLKGLLFLWMVLDRRTVCLLEYGTLLLDMQRATCDETNH